MKFYALTLADIKERADNVAAISASIGFEFQIVRAIDKRSPRFIDCQYDSRLANKIFGRALTAGEVCCAMGHYLMLKAYLDSGDLEPAFLIEDDAKLLCGSAKLVDIMSGLPGGCDMVSTVRDEGNHTIHRGSSWQGGGAFSRVWRCPLGTSSQIVTRRGAERLIKGMLPVAEPSDNYYQRRCWDLSIYVLGGGGHLSHNAAIPSVINSG